MLLNCRYTVSSFTPNANLDPILASFSFYFNLPPLTSNNKIVYITSFFTLSEYKSLSYWYILGNVPLWSHSDFIATVNKEYGRIYDDIMEVISNS